MHKPSDLRIKEYSQMGVLSKWLYELTYMVDPNLNFIIIGVFISQAINLLTGLMTTSSIDCLLTTFVWLSILFSTLLCISFCRYTFLHKALNDVFVDLRNKSTPLPAVIDHIFDLYYVKRKSFRRAFLFCVIELCVLIASTILCISLSKCTSSSASMLWIVHIGK